MDDVLDEGDPIGFGRRLPRLGIARRRELDQRLRRHGPTDASRRPTLLLGNLDAPIRQGEPVRLLEMDTPASARLLETREQPGLVGAVEVPQDRRAKLVHVTTCGRAIPSQVDAPAIECGQRLLDDVPLNEPAICHPVFDHIGRKHQAEAISA